MTDRLGSSTAASNTGLVERTPHRRLRPAGQLGQLVDRPAGRILLRTERKQPRPLLSCLADPGGAYELRKNVEHRASRVWHVSTVQTRVWKRSPMSELRRPDGSLGRFRIGKLNLGNPWRWPPGMSVVGVHASASKASNQP